MIGIVGMGVVGKAHKALFNNAIEYDLNTGTKEEINSQTIVFVCVPTPTKDNGDQDISAIEDVLSWLDVPIIILKSTVLPGTTRKLIKKFNKDITYSPEFLRQDFANEDINNCPIVVCGEESKANIVGTLYGREYIVYDKHEYGELLKYVMNSFLALKVSYFNQIFDMCHDIGIDYNVLKKGILKDDRIGKSHLEVTKERGYGGFCFPKDVLAITKKYRETVSILEEAMKYNRKIRNNAS